MRRSFTLDREIATEDIGPFPHADQAEGLGFAVVGGRHTPPIVLNGEDEVVVVSLDRNGDGRCPGVLGNIVQRFLVILNSEVARVSSKDKSSSQAKSLQAMPRRCANSPVSDCSAG